MRIEGTYTFPETIDRVFAALANPDVLARAIPGCERLIQLGPATPDGATTFEARLRPRSSRTVFSAVIQATTVRPPSHMRLHLRGRGPSGPMTGQGLIDLVGQEQRTIGAYAWNLEIPGLPQNDVQALSNGDGRQFVRAICERVTEEIRFGAAHAHPDGHAASLSVRTPRGRIVALPSERPASPDTAQAGAWAERAIWMGTGMLIGMATIGATFTLARRLSARDPR